MINLINQKLPIPTISIYNQIVWELFLKNQLKKKGNDITHFFNYMTKI